MKRFTLFFFVVIHSFCTASYAQQVVEWETDMETAVSRATEEDKLILLHFTADWCRPCKSLETFVFTSPFVVAAMEENVIPVKVDVDQHPDLVKEYGVSGIPHDIAVTPNGRVVDRRKSPETAANYQRMLESLTRNQDELENSNPKLAKSLKGLEEQYQPEGNPLKRSAKFAPQKPSIAAPQHAAPQFSTQGQQIARAAQRVQDNPYFKADPAKRKSFARISSADVQRPVETKIKINNDFAPTSGARQTVANNFYQPPKQMHQRVSNRYVQQPEPQIQSPILPQEPVAEVAQQIVEQVEPPLPAKVLDVSPEALEQKAMERQAIENAAIAKQLEQQIAQANPEATIEGVQVTDGNQPPAQPQKPAEPTIEFALHGKCPVSLLKDSKWIDGDERWGCVHRGRVYIFASAEKLRTFQSAPDTYSPILAGYDPVVFHENGKLVDGSSVNGVFMGKAPNKRVVLFSSLATRSRFQADPRMYLESVRQAMLQSDQQNKLR